MRFVSLGPVPPLRGGISHYNASLIGALRDAGHDVLPISFRKMYPPMLFPGSSELDLNSTPVEGMQRVLLPWSPLSWSEAKKLVREFEPDRIIAHHWHPFFVLAMRSVVSTMPKEKVDIVAHNVLPHEHGTVGRILNPYLFRHASRIYIGAKSEDKVLKRLAPGAEAVFMPHPVYDRFSDRHSYQKQAEAKRELGYSPDDILLVHLGLIRKYKGVDILLDAFKGVKQPNVRLEVAGEFYQDFEEYQHQVERLQLGDRVKLVNQYLSDGQLSLRLHAADAVVLPYRHATQSGIAMAALAAGVPVVASRVGSLADVVQEGELGCLAEPENEQDLTRALLRFLQIGVDRWRMSRSKIVEAVRSNYTWNALVAKIVREAE